LTTVASLPNSDPKTLKQNAKTLNKKSEVISALRVADSRLRFPEP
jgi:hypothetical protein